MYISVVVLLGFRGFGGKKKEKAKRTDSLAKLTAKMTKGRNENNGVSNYWLSEQKPDRPGYQYNLQHCANHPFGNS